MVRERALLNACVVLCPWRGALLTPRLLERCGCGGVLGDSALRGESRIVVLEADQEPNKEGSWRAAGWGSVGGGGSDANLLGRYRNC